MMFRRSNHIKEFTYSYGMHARWPSPLQDASVIAFLGVLTLLPAGGSSQLTMQCETAAMRADEKNILHHARFPSCCRLYLRRMLLARGDARTDFVHFALPEERISLQCHWLMGQMAQ